MEISAIISAFLGMSLFISLPLKVWFHYKYLMMIDGLDYSLKDAFSNILVAKNKKIHFKNYYSILLFENPKEDEYLRKIRLLGNFFSLWTYLGAAVMLIIVYTFKPKGGSYTFTF